MTTKNPIISTSLGSSLSRHVGSLSIPSPFTSTRLRLVPARDGNGNETHKTDQLSTGVHKLSEHLVGSHAIS